MFFQKKSAARTSARATRARKLHTIAGLLRARAITGKFTTGGTTYQFSYAPKAAAIVNRKLELTGSFSVTGPGGQTRNAENVRATLAATQGGLYSTITRPKAFNVATPSPFAETPNDLLPVTEFTGQQSFAGVLYLKLSALNGVAPGVPLDMSAVQLNARLAPTDAMARDLQWLFSLAVAALYGERADESSASLYVTELDRVLSA